MINMVSVKGLFPASATPYDSSGSINHAALETLLRRNLYEGASGFFVGGSSAECFLLSEQERISILETASTLKKETAIIAHVGAISTAEAIRYAKAAKTLGAGYIASTPPFYYGFNNAQIAKFFYDISDAADMPVMVYNFPGNTGKSFDLSDPDIRGLLKSDIVWGIKHTDYNLFLLERIMEINPKLVVMNGYDETMISGLAIGADGSVGSTFNVILPHFLKIYNAYLSGKTIEAQSLQVKANNILSVFCDVGLIAAIKYVLTLQGIDAGNPRSPFNSLTDEQKESVRDVLDVNLVV